MIMNILKLKSILFGLVAVLALSVVLTSCEQEAILPDTDVEITNDIEQFKSTTGNADGVQPSNTNITTPVLHHRFSGDISEEEAEVQWEAMVAGYISTLETTEIEERGVSTEWFYTIKTRTGTQTHNDTDGDVYSYITFATDKGTVTQGAWLNNFGNDREKGDWDAYFIRTYMPGQAVSWVEARSGQLVLKGTDGWFPTDFDLHVHSGDQSISASGHSHFYTAPNVWLDNSTSSGWDYYVTGNVGYGRLNF